MGQFLKQVMNTKSTTETEMVVVVPSSVSTTEPSLVYALDNRLITLGLRKWTKKVVLAENVEQGSFNHEGQFVMERIDTNLLFLHLSSSAGYKDIGVVKMLSQYSMEGNHAVLFPEPTISGGGGGGAKHVRLDAPEHVVSSNMDLMKILNGYSTSMYLGQLDSPRFSLNHLPTQQWYGPKGWAYVDFS